jgi:hypothetical protein
MASIGKLSELHSYETFGGSFFSAVEVRTFLYGRRPAKMAV